MTRKAPSPAAPIAKEPKLELQRIRVNAQGYDASDAYWGAGPDAFIATTVDGAEEITVRARNVTEARQKIAAELARKPGTTRSGEPDPIGGNSPHKSRYEIDWLNPVSNERVRIRIIHAREYLSSGSDHLEIESIKPKRAPLPISETGYRSHFIPALDLINAGGPVTFVTAWISQEAKGKAWTKAAVIKAQGDLFSWADAVAEVVPRNRARKPSKPVTNRIRQRRRTAENG
jgi:hypothetical protein